MQAELTSGRSEAGYGNQIAGTMGETGADTAGITSGLKVAVVNHSHKAGKKHLHWRTKPVQYPI